MKLDLSALIMDDEKIIHWVDAAPGAFHVSQVTNDTGLQLKYIQKFEKLLNIGYIERAGNRRGWYRRKETDLVEMDYKNASGEPVSLWLPFDLDLKVKIFKGNIIIIAGSKDSGKTATCLNIVRENEDDWNIYYFNSEMGEDEFQTRLNLFPYKSIDDWNFKAYERAGNFADVIKGGDGNLNIIDFLEIHDEFYIVGKRIKEIHDRLKGAIAIIAIQKNPGSETGLGGYRSTEKARLVINLDSGVVKIMVAKNWIGTDNPNGLRRTFKLFNGCEIITKYPWQRELEG
jgi:hypothetical protein